MHTVHTCPQPPVLPEPLHGPPTVTPAPGDSPGNRRLQPGLLGPHAQPKGLSPSGLDGESGWQGVASGGALRTAEAGRLGPEFPAQHLLWGLGLLAGWVAPWRTQEPRAARALEQVRLGNPRVPLPRSAPLPDPHGRSPQRCEGPLQKQSQHTGDRGGPLHVRVENTGLEPLKDVNKGNCTRRA